MDLFESARKAFGKAADEVARGAEALRLETEIADLSRRMEETWAAAGRRAQVLLKLGQIEDAELAALVKQAEGVEQKLLARQKALQALRQGARLRRCPGCATGLTELVEFCPTCGRRLPVCQKCLQPLSAEDSICPACGTAPDGASHEATP
ncbi:MAG: double zinc ribbon domain-containing protein [Candidatus Zipacnadales bacterium]